MYALATAFLSSASAIDLSAWKSFGASDNVRDFITVDAEVWALTSGGVVKINTGDLATAALTNADGLLTNDLEAGTVDAAGRTWLAGFGWLVRRNTSAVLNAFPLLDENNNPVRLYSLADDGDELWVGTGLGLALFDKVIDDGQFQDSYQRFGPFPARSAVVDIALPTDSIILATAPGLALADRRDPQALKSFANWTTFAVADFPALGGGTVTAVALFDGRVFVGATTGLFELTYTTLDTTITAVPGAPTAQINSLRAGAGTLDIYSDSGVYEFDGAVATAITLTGLPANSVTAGLSANGRRFLGVSGAGVYAEDGASFVAVETGAIPSEQVEDIAVSTGSRTLGAFALGGFAELLGAEWDVIEEPFNRRAISISFDSTGAVWLGTFGGGVYRVRNANSMFFDTTNSALKGNNDGGANNFIVVPEIVSGPRYTYFANFRASNGNPLVIVDQLDPARWTSIGAATGITDTFTVSIDQFDGLVAIASEKTGIYFVDPGQDPFNANDYQVTHFTESAPDPRLRLPSDEINVIRYDRFGDLWAGSRFGLARYDVGIERFVEVVLPLALGPEVTDLTFDPQDNLWIATPTGLGWFNRAAGEFTVFTTLNSGLVSNNINALAFDARINHLWIATDNGVSRFRPNIGQANFKLDQVTAYPNPFVITFGTEILHLNYSGVAQWRIFTESGELVWVGSSNAGWTGVNQSGAAVASGVYLFTLSVDGAETGVGKFALIQNR